MFRRILNYLRRWDQSLMPEGRYSDEIEAQPPHYDEADFGTPEWHDRLWEALPLSVRERALFVLRRELPADLRERIAAQIEKYGENEWYVRDLTDTADIERIKREYGMYIPQPFHFGLGMSIRNLLREKVCGDGSLPTGNWDDYYIKAISEAVQVTY